MPPTGVSQSKFDFSCGLFGGPRIVNHRDKHSHHLRSGAVRNRILEHYAFRWRRLSLGERRMRPHRPAFLIS